MDNKWKKLSEDLSPDTMEQLKKVQNELLQQKDENYRLRAEIRDLHQRLDESNQQIEKIKSSFGWKIFIPLRLIEKRSADLMEKTVLTHKIRKAFHILFHDGWKEFKTTFKRFMFVMKQKLSRTQEGIKIGDPEEADISYDSEYQKNEDYSEYSTDVKPLAFYLPQYHTFPENDQWWGAGFTEWVNVKNGEPRFFSHYQSRKPHSDFGYYSLTDIEVIRKQAKLACQHGIYGFVFYYYWFSGKRLMERPVDLLLQHPEIDLPFCLCWANENWTRAWDGKNKDILIGQHYSEEDDRRFIEDMKVYLEDSRYIRIHGKPIIIVYNPGEIPDCHRTFSMWRERARENGIGEILIWTCETANNTAKNLRILDCVDGIVEFPPHNMWLDSLEVKGMDLKGKRATLYHYGKLAEYQINKLKNEQNKKPLIHHGIMLGWDNAARRKNDWVTFCGFSLKALYCWMLAVKQKTIRDFPQEERFCFINAWNEWGEGTYLEPDAKYGYASINTISKALYSLPLQDDFKVFNDGQGEDIILPKRITEKATIAVQVHMFYLETLEETVENLNRIPFPFDCYVSTDTGEKQDYIRKTMSESCKAKQITVEVFENRGRDVAPFLTQMKDRYAQYDYICHIHSKKTCTDDYGNEWRKYNFLHLFGCEVNILQIIRAFEADPQLGLIMPELYPVLELQAEWGGNRRGVRELLQRLNCETDLPNDPVFPVGNMFWARSKAVKPLFDLGLSQCDFPEEEGQVNATLAHQIERCWIYMLKAQGYTYLKTFNNCRTYRNEEKETDRLCIYAHFDADHTVSRDDRKTIGMLSAIMKDILVISNSNLTPETESQIQALGDNITVRHRQNIGMDFGAWRDVLLSVGRIKAEQYDEIVLCNNSFFPPIYPMNEMFSIMEGKHLDFWGNTVFPRLEDGTYVRRDHISEHLQSYWMVFEKKVIQSDVFWQFWEKMPYYTEYIDVVANCESQFTELLADAGFTYEPYIRETYYMSRLLNNYSLPYEKPSSLLLLRDPFIKKKCYLYMDEAERIRLEYLKMAILSQ